MTLPCYIIQRQSGGVWVNYSCRYFLTPLHKVLLYCDAFTRLEPGERFRIVRSRAAVDPSFFPGSNAT